MDGNFIVVDIGCLECDEDSTILGPYPTAEAAWAAADAAQEEQRSNWKGQHAFDVWDLNEKLWVKQP